MSSRQPRNANRDAQTPRRGPERTCPSESSTLTTPPRASATRAQALFRPTVASMPSVTMVSRSVAALLWPTS
eukprot:3121224-Lingulodinium_polyedra.AAC.1